jgi:restriction endonuclease S subunit
VFENAEQKGWKILPVFDVLYGKLRPYLNKVWVADFDGIATTEILPFKADNKIVNPYYVAYYFRSPDFLTRVNENCSGARMPRLTTKFWEDAVIPVPDLNTQKKIVAYLNTLTQQQQQLNEQYIRKLQQLQSLKAVCLMPHLEES